VRVRELNTCALKAKAIAKKDKPINTLQAKAIAKTPTKALLQKKYKRASFGKKAAPPPPAKTPPKTPTAAKKAAKSGAAKAKKSKGKKQAAAIGDMIM
jgi:hypothetical protein